MYRHIRIFLSVYSGVDRQILFFDANSNKQFAEVCLNHELKVSDIATAMKTNQVAACP